MQGQYSDAQVIALFQKAVWEVNKKKIDGVTSDTRISDVGLDSLSTLEVMGYLEDNLELFLPEEEMTRIETVGELTKLINAYADKE